MLRSSVSKYRNSPRVRALIQPYGGGHSINWLLGHILSSRSFPLKLLGEAQVWAEASRARYRDGSSPIGAEGPGILPAQELMALFEVSQIRLVAGLGRTSAEQLGKPSGYAGNTVLDSLLYFHFHETYHVGQMTMSSLSCWGSERNTRVHSLVERELNISRNAFAIRPA